METASALMSSPPVMAVAGGFEEETATGTDSTTKVKTKTKARGRQQQTTYSEVSNSSNVDSKHQPPVHEGEFETIKAGAVITANVNNNNNEICTNVNGAVKSEKQRWVATNFGGGNVNGKKVVDGGGKEFCDWKDAATKISSKSVKATVDEQEEEDDEDNWESLIDNGTLDKSLEKFRIKGSVRLNDMNKEHRGDQQDEAKALSRPIKVNVRLEEPSQNATPPTFKILRREVATTGKVIVSSGTASDEAKKHFPGDPRANGQNAGIHRSTTPNGVPTPPAGKSFAQRQEEYARARMRILGCPGNSNGLAAVPSPAAQPRSQTGLHSTQKSSCGNIVRGFGSESTGGSRRGSYPGGAHRRHTSAIPSAQGYSFGNSSLHQQHHQNNNGFSNNGYYSGNRVGGGLHGLPINSGGFQGTSGSQQSSLSASATAATMHRTNGGTFGR